MASLSPIKTKYRSGDQGTDHAGYQASAPLDLSIFDNLDSSTPTMYEAREIAIERMQFEAAAAKAEGVVGVDIREGSYGWHTHVIEFFAIGTAVLPLAQEIAPEKIPDPIMVLSVND